MSGLTRLKIIIKYSDPIPLLSEVKLIADKGAKVRSVGMMDHVTQVLCHPIYYILRKVLDRVDADCTFNQDNGVKISYSTMLKGHPVQSIDVSAITDRIPLSIQLVVLEELLKVLGINENMISRTKAGLEALLGSSRTMRIRPTSSKETSFIRYAVGQPMGTNISFPLAALSHHVLVRLSARLTGLDSTKFNSYRILGDDQVISNKGVALSYTQLLIELGMEYSKTKSIGLASDRKGTLSEFAKRLMFKAEGASFEITPLSPQLLSRNRNLAIFDLYRKSYGDTIKIDVLYRGWLTRTLNDNTQYVLT